MVIYNALPRKEYERIFMCNTVKEIWKTLLITHQDSAFARFNTIITSLKALNEDYSSKYYVWKFLRTLHPKCRAKVTAIEVLKDLTSLSLDELIGNLKVYEMIIKKDSEIVKAKGERRSLDLKAKKESSDEECLIFKSEDKDRDDKNGKSDRKYFRCGDPNHLIGECPKPPKDKNQRAFVEGSWSDSNEEDDENIKDETCLVAQVSNEVTESSSPPRRHTMEVTSFLVVIFAVTSLAKDGKVICRGIGKKGLYMMKLGNKPKDTICLAMIDENSTLWHRRLGYANMRLIQSIEESLNMTFDETPPPSKTSPLVDDDLDEEEAIKVTERKNLENDIEDETLEINKTFNIKESRNHPSENIIGNLNQRTLRSQAQNQSNFFYFISTIEPKNVNEALTDESWIVAMQEELNQFIANDIWELVPQPRNMKIIGTKWVFRNKLDENGIVSQNKARILLAYACALDFNLFQMDVKSAFLNSFINKEVYVAQPPGFIDFEKPDHVYKLKKDLYGLKQALKAWYNRLKAFLVKHECKIRMVDNTLFTKKKS
uniref:Retrovirus-related Pol polyprotein from transposon TNT 1-94 n=1 Tax=Tanacetum cinerariifolium TaxID=118510 RepID=A0A6L2N9Z9_TANCI|nr:retrovirus-related Pol polyprotein from transposon TNT 1-94 [Tanacetum cinerariifolium]